MKKSFRLTLLTGIIFTTLSFGLNITASAACPLTNLFFGGFGNNNNSLFGGNRTGNIFSSLFRNNSGNNSSLFPNNNSSCPITNILNGGKTTCDGRNSTNCKVEQPAKPVDNCVDGSCKVEQPAKPVDNCADGSCKVEQPAKPAEPQTTPAACTTYAEEVLKYVNEARAKNNLSALQLDATLCAAAEVRAKEVTTRFSHTRPNGTYCFTVLREFGIKYSVCGENIALGFTDAKKVVDGWLNSSSHRANILNPNYKFMGLGKSGTGWCQLFTG